MLPGIEEVFLQYDFMRNALLAGLLVGALASTIGVFLVLRGAAMMGDGLAHIAFSGVALGLLLKMPPFWFALAFAIAGGAGIQFLRQRRIVLSDTAVAIFFTGGLAAGVIMVSASGGFNVDLFSLLFGSLVAVSVADLWFVAILGALLAIAIVLLFKELFYVTFDEEAAQVAGLPVTALNLALSILVAVTIVIAARVVGILLVSALLVLPAATALQVVRSFAHAFVTSIAIALTVVVAGLYLSFTLNTSMGGTIAGCSVLAFFLVVAGKALAKGLRPRAAAG